MTTITLETIELRPDEQYAGLVLKDDGTPLHHLVRMAEQTTNPLSWQDATAWASKAGGELPTRREMSLIYAHCRAHVKPEWYWSGEAFEADTSSAWSCHLGDGFQSTHLKSYENDAVAVRRIPIGGRAVTTPRPHDEQLPGLEYYVGHEPPPIKRTITLTVNGREWVLPEPLRVKPAHDEAVWILSIESWPITWGWYDCEAQNAALAAGQLYATKDDCQAWAEFDKCCRGGV